MSPELVVALALGFGVLAQTLAHALRIPGIVLLLATGLALGPEGLGWIQPSVLGHGLYALVSLSVAVILFEGARGLTQPPFLNSPPAVLQPFIALHSAELPHAVFRPLTVSGNMRSSISSEIMPMEGVYCHRSCGSGFSQTALE